MSKANTEALCENCGKPLFDRTDKRFCNDSCRNNFNRIKHNPQKHRGQLLNPEIFQIIKNNHEILSSYNLNPQSHPKIFLASTYNLFSVRFNVNL